MIWYVIENLEAVSPRFPTELGLPFQHGKSADDTSTSSGGLVEETGGGGIVNEVVAEVAFAE